MFNHLFIILSVTIVGYLSSNSSNLYARHYNQFNDPNVKLINFNINNYLASLNRLNGQNQLPIQSFPTNEQLLTAAANLMNVNSLLTNNQNLQKYQTLSKLLNNSNLGNDINLNDLKNLNSFNLDVLNSKNVPIMTLKNELNNTSIENTNLETNSSYNPFSMNSDNLMPEQWKVLILGMQKFSLNLIKSLHNFEPKDSSSGIILSPFSVWSALLVSYMGAKSDTEKEMAEALSLKNISKETVLFSYKGLKDWYEMKCKNMNSTADLSKSSYCSFANKIFFNSNLKLNKFVQDNFDQEIQSMDFVHEIEKSRLAINQWVEKKTNNKIKDLIAPGSINSFTNIVIANAIYFQAKWFTQFDPQKTIKGKFYVNPTEELTVSYMRQTANFMYGISESIKSTILELPYSNQELSMVLILPDPQMGIDSLIKQIKLEHLEEIFMNLYDDEIEVQIPKFKFEQEFELAGSLYSMGIKRVFDPRFSDFSGFLETNSTVDDETNEVNDDYYNKKNNNKVIINSVVHKAFISIDEEGTEAAAATAMLIARSGRPAFPSQFIANRPFLFMIRDVTTNVISFMGIVRRPSPV